MKTTQHAPLSSVTESIQEPSGRYTWVLDCGHKFLAGRREDPPPGKSVPCWPCKIEKLKAKKGKE